MFNNGGNEDSVITFINFITVSISIVFIIMKHSTILQWTISWIVIRGGALTNLR